MAEAYDKNVAPRFEPIAREVVRLADPKPNELFLDLGTGTGLLACLIAPRVLPQGVVAIDLADGAISVASYRAGNAGIRNIRFEMLDSRNIVYHGKLFDAAASNLGIQAPGFDRRDATTKTFRVRFADVTELIAFAASYGWYERELHEMSTESRKAFDADLAARLEALSTSAGVEDIWTLNLFIARSE